MKLLESIFVIFIISLIVSGVYILRPPKNNSLATQTALYGLKQARVLGLIDGSYPNINFSNKYNLERVDMPLLFLKIHLNNWQIQFHLSGLYTENSMSIYRDTPRFAHTTNFDNRPMAGDIFATSAFNSQCLSGYNNTNISDFCKNNTVFEFRLKERFRLNELELLNNKKCIIRNTFRFYFNFFGVANCDQDFEENITYILIGGYKITLINNTGYTFVGKIK